MDSRKSAKPSLLGEDRVRMLQLLQSLKEAGQLSELMNELQCAATTSGAMHDGAKRRFDDTWLELGEPDEAELIADQPPVLPSSSAAAEMKFPEGITSLTQWGKTQLTLPKYAKMRISYAQAVTHAKQEMDKGDPEMHEYLQWVWDHLDSHKSAKVTDFSKYLHAIEWNTEDNAVTYFPGTKETRRFIG